MFYLKLFVTVFFVSFSFMLFQLFHEIAISSAHTKESCVVEYRKCVRGCRKKHDTVMDYELCEYRCDSDYDWCLRKSSIDKTQDGYYVFDNAGSISY